MPIKTAIEVLDVVVQLGSTGEITFSGPDIANDGIRIEQAMALVRLKLEPSPGAAFPTHPLQWTQNGQPVPQPEFCTVRRVGPDLCILEIVNSAMSQLDTYFYVLVQVGDRFIGGDPTVLNMPPGGGDTQP